MSALKELAYIRVWFECPSGKKCTWDFPQPLHFSSNPDEDGVGVAANTNMYVLILALAC